MIQQALAAIGVWFLGSIVLAVAWMSIHSPSRKRYAIAREVESLRRELTQPPIIECALCGPTTTPLATHGHCAKCWPVVREVHAGYGHPEIA